MSTKQQTLKAPISFSGKGLHTGARANTPCIFLSALAKTNIEKFRSDLYGMVREIHAGRYPFNNFLY